MGVDPLNPKPSSYLGNRAVFLDRDGVLNHAVLRAGKPYPPASLQELEIIPGTFEALCRLRDAGFLLIGATNQPDVARGTQTREQVKAMNAQLLSELPIHEILVCYDDGDDCPRRKPNPGLLLEASVAYSINLTASFMIGDRWRDIEAGQRANCRTVWIDCGYDEKKPEPPATQTVTCLSDAVTWILQQTKL